MKSIRFLLLAWAVVLTSKAFCQPQIQVQTLDKDQLPKGIVYEGKLKTAVRWVDSLGENIVITSESGLHRSKKFTHENDGTDAELFAYHFLIQNNQINQTWKVYDYITDCPVDIEASFIKGTFHVTDLNEDGFAETWFMYKTVCHGDVSPSNLKIIMYQKEQKFAMRGQTKVWMGTDEKGVKQYDGGAYKFDKAFADGPQAFRTFAKKMWADHVLEKW